MAELTTLEPAGATPRIVALSGNPRKGSRTRSAAESLAAGLAAVLERPEVTISVIDLAEFGGAVLDGGPDVDTALTTVRSATVLVVATPVYKASYTGLLKAFLDRFGGGALAGVLSVPLTISASPIHRLVADVHLRPLLVELGATVPTRAFALEESHLATLDDEVARWLATEARLVKDLVSAPAAVG
ncbi:NADPH-dependent FMN reductase [Actinopolymorpha alba]|uniref:NADPH-dependent FMN reductase n=1 Tax=Actinopolymorpha alba TaxID=533267 RepID=UPI00037879B4|nr:NAD(P)H-dependent oxidoreductase [Actinopolymorpha alba]